MANVLRRLVSQEKQRYQLDGFDLDLAYIDCTSSLQQRLLAMSFPSQGREAWYRNNLKDVRRFLAHQKGLGGGTYKVYNLCAERPTYQADKLGGLVANFGFEDHQPPSLLQICAFCDDLDAFLSQHPDNFAAVHCKAGKGRTGVMICAYLLHKGYVHSAEEAMQTYARQRSRVGSGVTIPSQQRYIRYYEAAITEGRIPLAVPLALHGITVSGLATRQLADLVVLISTRCRATGELQTLAKTTASPSSVTTRQATRYSDAVPMAELLPQAGLSCEMQKAECVVEGDVRIEVYLGRTTAKRLLFRTWFNTAFMSVGSYTLRSWELDKGASAVKPGTVLRLQFGEALAAFDTSLQEAMPILDLPGADSLGPDQDTIPAIPLPPPQPNSGSRSPELHIFNIHPDFSIPSNFCISPSGVPPTPPPTPPCNPFATPAAQQLPQSPAESCLLDLSRCGTPVRELTDRLEYLAQSLYLDAEGGHMVDLSISRLDLDRRSQSSPVPWSKQVSFADTAATPLRSLSLVRTRPARGLTEADSDPELQDLSAPTTPSLPRPFTSFDWQRGSSFTALPSVNTKTRSHSVELGMDAFQDVAAFQEGTASGPDSPSHGARIIKWMSSSWWLSMA